MSIAASPAGARDPLFVAGDALLHDGYRVTAAYRGRLVGVESEFFVVDRESLGLRDCMDVLSRHSQFGRRVKPEIVHEQIELCTNAFASLAEMEAQMREDLREVVALLDGVGAMLLPVALHEGGAMTWTDDPSVAIIERHLGERFRSLAGTITADQINVGADDETDAFRIFKRLRSILPDILGLGASSPFRNGRSNGRACNRMAIYDEALSAIPELTGVPPALESLADYARFIGAQPRFRHPRTCYAYLRPMPERGVAAEIRCIDKQASIAETMGFAALAKAVMLSNGQLAGAMDDPEAALCLSRHDGLVDAARTSMLVASLAAALPGDEARYLGALAPERRESAATRLVALQESVGEREMRRRLAERLREDIRGG